MHLNVLEFSNMPVKPKSPEIIKISGTAQPCRARASVVEHIAGDPERPKWLTGRARRIWDARVELYLSRGQSVKGCEEALAQYASLEADLIDQYWRKKITPPISMVNAHRIYANEFFDTPASQIKPSGGNSPTNPFSRNGKPPCKR
jgi:hypothetical protein